MSLKIIHTSDVHLGAKLNYLGDKAGEHRATIAKSFQKVVSVAMQKKTDVFLVAGDLFDDPFPDKDYIDLVINEFSKLVSNGMYVAVIPGNHDRLAEGSVFLKSGFKSLDQSKFKLFLDKQAEQWVIPELELTIHGRAVVEQKSKQSQLSGIAKNSETKYNVGLVHGSLDIITEPDNYPIYKKDIEKLDFDYLALGDWHSSMDATAGKTKSWYSGSPEVISVSQKGAGNCVYVEIDKSTKVELIPVGSRSIKELEVDLGKYTDQSKLVDDILSFSDSNSILILNIKGIKALDQQINTEKLLERLKDDFYYVRIKDNSDLEISEAELEKYPEELIIGKYIRLLNKKRTENDYLVEEINMALQLGVKLLKGEAGDN